MTDSISDSNQIDLKNKHPDLKSPESEQQVKPTEEFCGPLCEGCKCCCMVPNIILLDVNPINKNPGFILSQKGLFAEWIIQWELPVETKCQGYVIQEVEVQKEERLLYDKENINGKDTFVFAIVAVYYKFYELWYVPANEKKVYAIPSIKGYENLREPGYDTFGEQFSIKGNPLDSFKSITKGIARFCPSEATPEMLGFKRSGEPGHAAMAKHLWAFLESYQERKFIQDQDFKRIRKYQQLSSDTGLETNPETTNFKEKIHSWLQGNRVQHEMEIVYENNKWTTVKTIPSAKYKLLP